MRCSLVGSPAVDFVSLSDISYLVFLRAGHSIEDLLPISLTVRVISEYWTHSSLRWSNGGIYIHRLLLRCTQRVQISGLGFSMDKPEPEDSLQICAN